MLCGKLKLKSSKKGKRHSFLNGLKRKVKQIELEEVILFYLFDGQAISKLIEQC